MLVRSSNPIGTRRIIGALILLFAMSRQVRFQRATRMQGTVKWCCGLALTFALAGCVPGGLFMPTPIPHYDRPAIHGVLLRHGRPVERQRINALSFSNYLTASCSQTDAGAETNYMGEFEIVGDRDLMTLWWGSGPDGFALCLPDAGENAFWSTRLKRSEFPPFLPEQVDVICHLGPESVLRCITSLADEMMIDCTDDLEFDASSGWLDAETRTPYSGRCVSYHDNGELLERAEFIQGVRVGPWTGYAESGLRAHRSFWIDGQRRRETLWHPNGQMSRQTHYRSKANREGLPVRHGLDTVWTEGGSIDSQRCWIDGLEQDVPAEKCYFE